MKKFLEVLMDADSVERPVKDMNEFQKIFDQINRRAIRGMVNAVWKEKNLDVAKAIRYLSMAEIITCAEPYEGAEQLWSSLMFEYLPHYERFSDQLKVPHGYDPSKKTRPLSWNCRQGLISLPFKMPGMN